MKKILLSLFMVVAITTSVTAATTTYEPANRVQAIGTNLLTKNGITTNDVKFMVVSDTPSNADFASTKTVYVSAQELSFTGNDNEVASVVASELGHIIYGHGSSKKVFNMLESNVNTNIATSSSVKTFASNYKTTKQDKEADLVAVNLMVNAGYNPLALIVVLTKQTGTYWDTVVGRPANADKAMNVFDYISYVYPEKIKVGYGCNEYRNFKSYADTILEERKNNKKLASTYNKDYSKAKKNTEKQISSFKIRGGLSAWDAVYGIMNATQSSN